MLGYPVVTPIARHQLDVIVLRICEEHVKEPNAHPTALTLD